MNADQAKKRIEELTNQINYHAKKYYDEDTSEISDFEYDMLTIELRNLKKEYPELVNDKASRLEEVGGKIKEGFAKVEHEVPLLSLQDVFDYAEVEAFDNRMKKAAEENGKELKYVVETKIDGLSVSLKYVNGEFIERCNAW